MSGAGATPVDTAILTWIHAHATPAVEDTFRLSNELGRWPLCVALVVVMALWHAARRERRGALAWMIVGLAVGLVPEIVKALTARPRPEMWLHLVEAPGYSFPSGHATAGAALFPLLAFVVGRAWPAARRGAWALALALGAFVGLGRLVLGVHWPSDVLAGWLLGALLCAGAIRWLRAAPPPPGRAGGRGRRKTTPDGGDTMREDIQRLLVRELNGFLREIELFPDEATVWKTLPGLSNSAGNLALHVCGNLKHFVGTVLGGTGYVRRREQEFEAREVPRAEVLREIRETIDVVSSVFARLPPGALDEPYPESHGGVQLSGRMFLLHVCTHAAFHLGQAGYLRRALTADSRSSGALAIRPLADT